MTCITISHFLRPEKYDQLPPERLKACRMTQELHIFSAGLLGRDPLYPKTTHFSSKNIIEVSDPYEGDPAKIRSLVLPQLGLIRKVQASLKVEPGASAFDAEAYIDLMLKSWAPIKASVVDNELVAEVWVVDVVSLDLNIRELCFLSWEDADVAVQQFRRAM